MAQYTKRKDGRYSTKLRTPDGKNKYVYGRTITELKQKVAKLQSEIMTGTYADDKGMTVGEWAEKWMETYKTKVGINRKKALLSLIKNHLEPIRDIRIRDLRSSDIQGCINKIDKPTPQAKTKDMLREMLERAVDNDMIAKNPCRNIEVAKQPKPDTRGLTEQEKRLLPTLDLTSKEKAYVYISWYAGLRPGEIRALTKGDIDLKNKVVHVNNSVADVDSYTPVLKSTKTEAGVREVGILNPLLPVLKKYLKECKELYLFPGEDGGLLPQNKYRSFWRGIFNKLNTAMGGNYKMVVCDLNPYVFRHEYATMLYYSGVDIKEAVRLMGHTDAKHIINIYAELDKDRSNSTEKLNQFLANY